MRDLGCIQFMQHCAKEKFFLDIFDEVAFFAAVETNRHVRLISVAVLSEHQRKGYGRKIQDCGNFFRPLERNLFDATS